MHFILGVMLTMLALFLILIILVQRGRGGGLSGALGGMGGQSAFGTKAGDAFTKITVGMSIAWIVMCIITSLVLGRGTSSAFGTDDDTPAATSNETGAGNGAGGIGTTESGDGTTGIGAEVTTEGGVSNGVESAGGDEGSSADTETPNP